LALSQSSENLDPTIPEPINPLARLWFRAVTLVRTARMFWKFTVDKPRTTRPQGQIPVDPLTRESLEAAPDRTLWRLGHSTVLLKLQGAFFLTDPVFAHRASPLFFAGPKRFHQPPIAIRELPPLKAILLSHDHYDHLDKRAMQKLARKTDWIIAPRGVGGHLRRWGIQPNKIRELDWHQQTPVATPGGTVITLTCTPTRHFSGRSLWNRNQTLFCSWVIEDMPINDSAFRIFYGADSGYFSGFREIGQKYGPFAVTLLENGAYNQRWSQIHMQPEETIQAHLDLNPNATASWLIPIHNGTFDLAFHPWTEPMERIQHLANARNMQVSTPRFGEPVQLDHMHPAAPWWRTVDSPGLSPASLQTESNPSRS
jgi:L-ascorbate metabolism protein UlaG (beta-lactamase superfamily)